MTLHSSRPSRGVARIVCATPRTEALAGAVLSYRNERGCAPLARTRACWLPAVTCPIITVRVAPSTRRDDVVRRVVERVAVEVVRANLAPRQPCIAPVARRRDAPRHLPQHRPTDSDLARRSGERVIWQVSGGPVVSHANHYRAPWRTNDRNQLAKVLGHAKTDAPDEHQLDLFGEATA